MSGAAFLYAAVVCCAAAVVWHYRDVIGGSIALGAAVFRIRARMRARYWITAFLLFYFRQHVAAVWLTLHNAGLNGCAARYYRKYITNELEQLGFNDNLQFAVYCAGHLQAADNDAYTAAYIGYMRAGHTVIDLIFPEFHFPEDQQPDEWIIHETISMLQRFNTETE